MERDHFSQFPDPIIEDGEMYNTQQGRRQHRSPSTPTPAAGEVWVIKANPLAMEEAQARVEERERGLDEADRYGIRLLQPMEDGSVIIHNRPWR